MQVIYKYPIATARRTLVLMPVAAEILSANVKARQIYVWAKVNTQYLLRERTFYVLGTGHTFPAPGDYMGPLEFIDTVHDRQYVWHVFDGGYQK